MPKRTDIHKVLIIGSGPIIIGQACGFDYSGTQACKALRKLGYEIVLVNSNPATIMTDPETADVTYIEPLNVERLEPVSYTHLDVYKRQIFEWAAEGNTAAEITRKLYALHNIFIIIIRQNTDIIRYFRFFLLYLKTEI